MHRHFLAGLGPTLFYPVASRELQELVEDRSALNTNALSVLSCIEAALAELTWEGKLVKLL